MSGWEKSVKKRVPFQLVLIMAIRIQIEDFDLSAEMNRLRSEHRDIGAVVSFIGTVRDVNDDDSILSMELEHYPGMTESALQEIESHARQRWDVIDSVVIHRVGLLKPTDQIVLVVVASRHRGEAFRACEYIIDALKTQAPFWKKEQTAKGDIRWVDAKQSDDVALKKW